MKFLLSVFVAAMMLIGLAAGQPNANANNNVIVIGKPAGAAAPAEAPSS